MFESDESGCKWEAARTLAGGRMVTRQLSYTHAERRKVGGRRVEGGGRKRKPSVCAYGGGGGNEGGGNAAWGIMRETGGFTYTLGSMRLTLRFEAHFRA